MALSTAIPTEIWISIFQLLPKRSTGQCTLVCKAWYKPAAQVLFKGIMLSKRYGAFLESKLFDNEEQRDQNPANLFTQGSLVKKLKVPESSMISHDLLPFIFGGDMFPDIRFINLSGANSQEYHAYISFLHNSTRIEDMKSIKQDTPPTINKRDITPQYFNSFNLHYMTCYKFRQTITTLDINRLRFLHHTKDCGESILAIFSVLKACPHLESFKFESHVAFPDIAAGSISSSTTSLLTLPQLNYLDQLSNNIMNLKCLDLQLFRLPTHYIQCLIAFIHSYVNTFSLSLSASSLYNWILNNNFSTILQLANRLTTIPNVEILTRGPTSTYPQVTDDVMNKCWEFIRAMKGGRDLEITHVFREPIYMTDLFIEIKANRINLYNSLYYSLEKPGLPSFIRPLKNDMNFLRYNALHLMRIVTPKKNIISGLLTTALNECPWLKCISVYYRSNSYILAPELPSTDSFLGRNKIPSVMLNLVDNRFQLLIDQPIVFDSILSTVVCLFPHMKELTLVPSFNYQTHKFDENAVSLDLSQFNHLESLTIKVVVNNQPLTTTTIHTGRLYFIIELLNNRVMFSYKPGTPIFQQITDDAYRSIQSVPHIRFSHTMTIKCSNLNKLAFLDKYDKTLFDSHQITS